MESLTAWRSSGEAARGFFQKNNMQHLPEVLRRLRALVTAVQRRCRWSPWKCRLAFVTPTRARDVRTHKAGGRAHAHTHTSLRIQWQFEQRRNKSPTEPPSSRADACKHCLAVANGALAHLHSLYTCWCVNLYRLSLCFFFFLTLQFIEWR